MKALHRFLAAGLMASAVVDVRSQDADSSRLRARPDQTINVSSDSAGSSNIVQPVQLRSGPLIDERMIAELAASTNIPIMVPGPVREDQVDYGKARVEGGVAPLVKRPTLGRFLQLFNPFAPAEYGGTAGVAPQGATLSRAFHDPVKSQPASSLITVGNRPEAAANSGNPDAKK